MEDEDRNWGGQYYDIINDRCINCQLGVGCGKGHGVEIKDTVLKDREIDYNTELNLECPPNDNLEKFQNITNKYFEIGRFDNINTVYSYDSFNTTIIYNDNADSDGYTFGYHHFIIREKTLKNKHNYIKIEF